MKQSNLKKLVLLKSETISLIDEMALSKKKQATKRFKINNGCNECRGRGWVVTWDSMDSSSGCYAEYGSCKNKNCNEASRDLSGFYPSSSKYDKINGTLWEPKYTEKEKEALSSLEIAKRDLDIKINEETRRWQPSYGKVVTVFKESRVRNKERRVPIGTSGIILKLVSTKWGTQKLIIRDSDGNQWWPTISQVKVIDPEPDAKFWNEVYRKSRENTGLPSVVTIMRKSGSAGLVKTTQGLQFWVPFSQVPEIKKLSKGSTASILIPMWLAKKNNLIT